MSSTSRTSIPPADPLVAEPLVAEPFAAERSALEPLALEAFAEEPLAAGSCAAEPAGTIASRNPIRSASASRRWTPVTRRTSPARPTSPTATTEPGTLKHALRLGRYRPIWAAPEVEISPALHFTVAEQQLELSPGDAARMGISHGDIVEVAERNGHPAAGDAPHVRARAAIRTGVLEGVAFLADGIRSESANVLTEPLIEVRKP